MSQEQTGRFPQFYPIGGRHFPLAALVSALLSPDRAEAALLLIASAVRRDEASRQPAETSNALPGAGSHRVDILVLARPAAPQLVAIHLTP